jgi:2-polyprenyl-3-methyl-5-hydroxy-6-metoxy-1,4-benzoquinol methylase
MSECPLCPICRSDRSAVVDRLNMAELDAFWAEVGVRLSSAAKRSYRGAEELRHLRCGGCGFEFFDPVAPGNAAFYAELQDQITRYYPTDSPAFFRAIDRAKAEKLGEVMDLGCGAGAFLDHARVAGLRTHGLDLNTQAVLAVRARGHDVLESTAEDFARRMPERRFRMVTSFEVMEHVPDPVAFFAGAARLVAPGGYLAISVPNNEGVHRWCSLEPRQWPPHHLTRWRRKDLERLGRDNGLEVVLMDADILRGVQMRHYFELQRAFEKILGRKPTLPGPLATELIVFLYRIALCRRYLKLGISLHVHYRRPAG